MMSGGRDARECPDIALARTPYFTENLHGQTPMRWICISQREWRDQRIQFFIAMWKQHSCIHWTECVGLCWGTNEFLKTWGEKRQYEEKGISPCCSVKVTPLVDSAARFFFQGEGKTTQERKRRWSRRRCRRCPDIVLAKKSYFMRRTEYQRKYCYIIYFRSPSSPSSYSSFKNHVSNHVSKRDQERSASDWERQNVVNLCL